MSFEHGSFDLELFSLGTRFRAATSVKLDDGTVLKGKGKQFIPHGRKVILEFPGGGGYGDPARRDENAVKNDFARGYISKETAQADYGLTDMEIETITKLVEQGAYE